MAHGEAIFSPAITERLINMISRLSPAEVEAPFPELTQRESEILTLVAQGLSNAEIARRSTLCLKTVRNHVSSILNKLQVSDRFQAAMRARDAGLGEEDK